METPFPNQPPPYADRNLYADDVALQEAVAREGAAWVAEDAMAWGATLGSAQTLALADAANRHPPELRNARRPRRARRRRRRSIRRGTS